MMMPEFTTGTESRDLQPMNVMNTELSRVGKSVDVEDRGNLLTYPRHLQQQKRHRTDLHIQNEI